MGFSRFEDIIAWRKSQLLAIRVYDAFKFNKNYYFRDQIGRASLSVSNNIAEGFEREFNKDFRRFLRMAKGSNTEVKSMIYLAIKMDFLNKEQGHELLELSREVGKLSGALTSSIDIKRTNS